MLMSQTVRYIKLIYVIYSHSTGPGIYSTNQPESEDAVRGQARAVYIAINPWQLCYNYYIPPWLVHNAVRIVWCICTVLHSNWHSKQTSRETRREGSLILWLFTEQWLLKYWVNQYSLASREHNKLSVDCVDQLQRLLS